MVQKTIDPMELFRAFYQFAHRRREYTDERDEFYTPEPDSSLYGSPGSYHHFPATRVFFYNTRKDGCSDFTGDFIPIIPDDVYKINLVFGRYVGPIEIRSGMGGVTRLKYREVVTNPRMLEKIAKNLLKNMKNMMENNNGK